MIGLLLGAGGRSWADWREEHGEDFANPELDVESSKGGEGEGQGGNEVHGLNSSFDAGSCA